MRILYVTSYNMIAPHVAYILKQEGHEVKLCIDGNPKSECFDNMVEKTADWKKELAWVGKGKGGLIVFDDVGYGRTQDRLRKQGYSVFGGCAGADKLEGDREYAQKIFAECGMKVVPIKNFVGAEAALRFMRKHKAPWVIKQNGKAEKNVNYVAHFTDGRDAIRQMETYRPTLKGKVITLQERVQGIELGCARYFNGNDWVGPVEMNIEYKKMFPGNLGPTTGEMGTLAWYDDKPESNKLFRETLAPMRDHLKSIDFRGDIDVNVIIDEKGDAYPLEATPRFGSPIVYIHAEFHTSPWGEFLKAVADGEQHALRHKRGYGIVLALCAPPAPYVKKLKSMSPKGLDIYFDKKFKSSDLQHVGFEGVAARNATGKKQFYIADEDGYVAYVTGSDKTVEGAKAKAERLAEMLYFPKMFYRTDIGDDFIEPTFRKLRKWGYV